MSIVVDNSVFMAHVLSDEANEFADRVMDFVGANGGIVPGSWWYEFRNVLSVSQRRGRISPKNVRDILIDIDSLNLDVDFDHDETTLFAHADRFELSIYDASYLELAFRRGTAFATLDVRLREASQVLGIPTA